MKIGKNTLSVKYFSLCVLSHKITNAIVSAPTPIFRWYLRQYLTAIDQDNTMFRTLFSTLLKIKQVKVNFLKPGLELCLFRNSVGKFSTASVYLKRTRETSSTDFDQHKAKIIMSLNFESNEDSLPFLRLPLSKLCMIQRITENDKKKKFCNNRLYFISSKLKCPPSALSKRLIKRTFVYTLTFDWLKNSLDTLLELGVTGDRILRDLWVLKYNHKTINQRLQKIKEMGIDVLYPWMVRCSPSILERYISLTQETKTILGESKSTQMYLAERLNISKEEVEDMWAKIPALKTIRATKMKKFLDFLIDEGYTLDDIAKRPRVLTTSQKTVKHRLDKVRSLGLHNVNLNLFCKSRKNFEKYVDSLELDKKDCKDSSSS